MDSPTSLPSARPELRRVVGFWGGIAVMIGVIIGSGIFKTPPEIAKHFGSPMVILGLWVAGGLLCLAGALTYAELAAMYPSSGGVYVFIREGYGNCAAFVFGWAYLVLVKPFGAGGIAYIFGESLGALLGITDGVPKEENFVLGARAAALLGVHTHAHTWVQVLITLMLVGLTWVNLRNMRASTSLAAALTALKFGALAAIVILVIVRGRVDLGALKSGATSDESVVGAIAAVIASILWTYDGWADVGAIAGEVRDPQRTLPRIYIGGMLGIIAIYVLVNAAYFMIVPLPEMRTAAAADASYSVAPDVVRRLFGVGKEAAGAVVLAIIMLSTFGSTHASIMTGARVSYAQARDGLLFRVIGHVHPRWHTPDVSLISETVLSIIAVWFLGSFQALADGFVFTMWIFYAMAGAAIFVVRAKRPDAPRPFRCPGYPVVPAVFVLVSLGMTGLAIWEDRGRVDVQLLGMELGEWRFVHTVPWLAVLVAGAPVYWVWRMLWPERDVA
jgi:amino acid transporter